MSLTTNDVVNLLAIRSLRDVAAAQARTAGMVQRQITVILLDAAIERAVFTACEYLQISLAQNAKLDTALQQLTAHGWKPAHGVESDRKRLHQQRNNVQHLGGNIDRDELPGWVITTEQYVANVVRFAFGVDLDDVHYAAAIADYDIAGELARAEDALLVGDLDSAMRAIDSAFTRTKTVWDSFAVIANRELAARRPHYEHGLGEIGGDDPKMVALQEVALLTAIAPDAGEVLWYLSARGDRALLSADEVRRALVFVFTLAAAVEATPAATRVDRRLRDAIAQRHQRAQPQQRAHLGEYTLRRLGERTTATFTLIDVPPPKDYAAWRAAVTGALNITPAQIQQFSIWDDGTLSIYDVRDIDTDVDAVIAALEGADDLVLAAEADAARVAQAEIQVEASYRQRLADALPSSCPPWLHVEAVRGYGGENPWVIAMTVDRITGNHWDLNVVQAAFDAAGVQVHRSYHGWMPQQQQPEDLPGMLDRLVPHLQAAVDTAAAVAASREEALRDTVIALARKGLRRRGPTES